MRGKTRSMQAWIAAAAVDAPRSYFWTSVKIQGKKIEVDPLNGIVLLTRRVAYIIFGHALYTINIYIYLLYEICLYNILLFVVVNVRTELARGRYCSCSSNNVYRPSGFKYFILITTPPPPPYFDFVWL